jgi:hypothetical protein
MQLGTKTEKVGIFVGEQEEGAREFNTPHFLCPRRTEVSKQSMLSSRLGERKMMLTPAQLGLLLRCRRCRKEAGAAT